MGSNEFFGAFRLRLTFFGPLAQEIESSQCKVRVKNFQNMVSMMVVGAV